MITEDLLTMSQFMIVMMTILLVTNRLCNDRYEDKNQPIPLWLKQMGKFTLLFATITLLLSLYILASSLKYV